MKRITIILIMISTILSLGSCINIDDFRPDYSINQPDDNSKEPEDEVDDDNDVDSDDDSDDDLDDDNDDVDSRI